MFVFVYYTVCVALLDWLVVYLLVVLCACTWLSVCFGVWYLFWGDCAVWFWWLYDWVCCGYFVDCWGLFVYLCGDLLLIVTFALIRVLGLAFAFLFVFCLAMGFWCWNLMFGVGIRRVFGVFWYFRMFGWFGGRWVCFWCLTYLLLLLFVYWLVLFCLLGWAFGIDFCCVCCSFVCVGVLNWFGGSFLVVCLIWFVWFVYF